jgi:hypothetical protein
VRNLRAGSPDRQVVSADLDVARNFGIQALGVDFAQGFHTGRPSPA